MLNIPTHQRNATKTTISFTPVRMATIKKNTNIDKDVEKLDPLHIV
jgi:hypothetical protein